MLMCVAGMLICAGFGLQASSGGGETEQQGKCGEKRVPSKGDVLEFEMAEESAPGGVEWLSGTVTSVDAKKKNFKAIIAWLCGMTAVVLVVKAFTCAQSKLCVTISNVLLGMR